MVRVKDIYLTYDGEQMGGAEAVLLRKKGDSCLIGLPLDGTLGWYDSEKSTEYRCWWISEDYLEPVQVFSHNKFK